MSETTLDEKLDSAIASARMYYTKSMQPDIQATNRALKEAVKQAFVEAGWVKTPTASMTKEGWIEVSTDRGVRHNGVPLLAGEEWYKRFEAELERHNCSYCGQNLFMREAAKRASGVKEDL